MSDVVEMEQIEPGIAVVRIARESALNALNHQVLAGLEKALDELERDESARVVIVTGKGSKAFVAGADIDVIHALPDAEKARQFAAYGQHVFERWAKSRVISFAAINGYALGGGLELAMALDIRVASERARMGQPEINLGIVPGFGGTQRLPRLVGEGRALWMILSGDPIKADEAMAIGLVDAVCPGDRLLEEVIQRARILAAKAPLALSQAKRLVRGCRDWALHEGLDQEAQGFSEVAFSEDGREGTEAFLEKRPATFHGK